MITFGLRKAAKERRRRVFAQADDFWVEKSEWMDCGQDAVVSPSVFLIEQEPGSVLKTHYHRQNQFQLFVRGSGSIGPHAIAPYTLHYAGAYTGYGPITAGAQGLDYFTLRATFDSGASFVPEALGAMLRGPRRQAQAGPFTVAGVAGLERQSREMVYELLGSEKDTLHARRRLLPAAAYASVATGAAGVFGIVLQGQLGAGDQQLQEWESFYVSPDEAAVRVMAGPAGCEFLTLRMPPLALEYLDPARAATVR